MLLVLSLFACQPPSGELLDEDGDGAQAKYDCDDADPAINPAAEEVCDGVDNNCDGAIDEVEDASTPAISYLDEDFDGYGGEEAIFDPCNPTGTVSVGGDCDDGSDLIYPGAPEVCDGVDNNCNGATDDEDGDLDVTSADTFYKDADDDGYGDPTQKFLTCLPPDGAVTNFDDCDDGDATISPVGEEACDGVDNDCDDLVDDEDAVTDLSSGVEGWGDADADGFGDPTVYMWACERPDEYVDNPDDCDDDDADVRPDAPEVCDDKDDDCNGLVDMDDPGLDLGTALTVYDDVDADGFGDGTAVVLACTLPAGTAAVAGDCDDTDGAINPLAIEACDGVDNDCDTLTDDADDSVDADLPVWPDEDGDGYGNSTLPSLVCEIPKHYVENGADCDDTDAAISPVATEVCGTPDDDCDSLVDDADPSLDLATTTDFAVDSDGDGHGGTRIVQACGQPAGTAIDSDDCDDADASVSPDGSETCEDGIDQDCDGNDRRCVPLTGTLSATSSAYAERHGEVLSTAYGSALAALDWDGDGQIDLAVGASGSSDGASLAGGVYLHNGLVTGTLSYLADPDGTFLGTSIGALAGTTIAAAPDMDGDGDQELFVSDGSSVETGLLLGGTASGNIRTVRAWTEVCLDAVDLGDDDRDGAHTWACANGTGGSLRVYEGIPGFPDATYSGTATNDYLGYHAVGADFDGDGLTDLLVGAPGINDGARTDAGGAIVLQAPFADAAYNSADMDLLGETTSGSLGTQVAAADLDGDGLPDVLASSPYASAGGTNSGAWYGWYGLPARQVGPSAADYTLNGDAASESLGRGRLSARDIDGDGVDELAVASSTVAKNGTGSGAAWVVYGRHGGTESVADAATYGAYIPGEASLAAMGSDLMFCDDLTGDGVPELLLGASGMTGPSGNRAGVVYVLSAQ